MFKRRELIQSAAQSVVALAASAAGLGAHARAAEAPLPRLGDSLRLPGAVTLLDGRVWSAAQAQGKTLVVYWWASWCPFCALQSPHMEALWRAQQAHGLELLALSIDQQAAAAVNYIKAKGYSFPAAMLTPEVAKVLPKPAGLPVVLVLKVHGRDGKVVFAESGEMFPEDVEGLKKYL